jgi:acyl transferase domain-containing protein
MADEEVATPTTAPDAAVAIVGMAGRFPGASDAEVFWRSLCDGEGEAAAFPDLGGFDAAFFGMTALDAAIMDPQHRHFLECCCEAFEHAGVDPTRFDGRIAVFAGCGADAYLLDNLLGHGDLVEQLGIRDLRLRGNDKDLLASRVSFHLDLRGPSVAVQSGGSSSLVAVHLACQSILSGECDMALAGGANLDPDAAAPGNAVGVVLLRRLEDALAAGDPILALVRGSAVGHDGAGKATFLAPSPAGAREAVAEALALADVDARTIGYVDVHEELGGFASTAELEALSHAFGRHTAETGFCVLGSVRSRIGDGRAAAGVAALIAAVQALRHEAIPATLRGDAAAGIELTGTPFLAAAAPRDWPRGATPRRAGVGGRGAGGTNAYVVLEEAPRLEAASGPGRTELLVLSARSPAALDEAAARLASHLRARPETDLSAVARTLSVGRRACDWRRTLVCATRDHAIEALERPDADGVAAELALGSPPVAFLLPGPESLRPSLGSRLHAREAVFRRRLDECLAALESPLRDAVQGVLLPDEGATGRSREDLVRAVIAYPAIVAFEYALAGLWISWGIVPSALLGHGAGQTAAACLAGVLGLADGLALAAVQGHMLDCAPQGELPEEAIAEYAATMRGVALSAPKWPVVSTVTGQWIDEEQARDAEHWAAELAGHARPDDALARLLDDPDRLLLEVGPGEALVERARCHAAFRPGHRTAASLPAPDDPDAEEALLLDTLGRLWLAGAAPDWEAVHGERRRSAHLPTTPWDHERHWIDRVERGASATAHATAAAGPARGASAPGERPSRRDDPAEWFYTLEWRRSLLPRPEPAGDAERPALVLLGESALGAQIADALQADGRQVAIALAGDARGRVARNLFVVRPNVEHDYDRLIATLKSEGRLPRDIVHMWNLLQDGPPGALLDGYEEWKDRALTSLLHLARALARADVPDPVTLHVVSNGMQEVAGEGVPAPLKALLLGPCRVLPREYPNLRCRSIDVVLPSQDDGAPLVERLVAEIHPEAPDDVVAYRGRERFVEDFARLRLDPADSGALPLRENGVYLITGGLGGLGLALAEHLAKSVRARLMLVGRHGLPSPDGWRIWLEGHHEHDPTSRRIRSMQALEELGAKVMVAEADVSDLTTMREVVGLTRSHFGALHGVFHSTGVDDHGLVQFRSEQAVDAVLGAKVRGALVLDEALAEEEPDFLVLHSSIVSVAGMAGRADSSAADAFLDAWARHRTDTTGKRTVSIAWGPWREVGATAEYARCLEGGACAPGVDPAHPLLGRSLGEHDGEERYAAELGPASDWLLSEHRLEGGDAILPAAAYLAIADELLGPEGPDDALQIRDLFLPRPFAVRDDELRQLRVRFRRESGELMVESPATEGDALVWLEHARAAVTRGEVEAPDRFSIGGIRNRCNHRTFVGGPLLRDANRRLGPRWNCVRRIDLGPGEALVEIEIPPEYAPDLGVYPLHPALLDAATACAPELIRGFEPERDFYVPASYGRVVVRGPLPPKLYSRIRIREGDDATDDARFAVFDVTLLDESGKEIASIEQFAARRVDDRSPFEAPPALASASPATETARQPVAARHPLLAHLAEAIHPTEGGEAVDRILAHDVPAHVLVSPQELAPWLRLLGAPPAAPEARPSPAVGEPKAPPRTETERAVAEIWRELLGVPQIGRHDNFFDAGGDSLLAMRALVRLETRLGVRASSSLLVLHTLEQVAAECDKCRTEAIPEEPAPEPVRSEPPRRRARASRLFAAMKRGAS